ncbi:leucine/isoleucine/valine transporter permease subunit [Pirellula sp. SH-Sr6A]|uniref:branched-chain amino acid ABC transporter permease n=1 Tax=Pirellula sp. SH-Sr6A TaxID=1632865 RepID=UPI00078D63D2|nr:branched-chain amino acid ABC transporter permease [Pirellula sp. SH-Sr6A]AMV35335.1 leucine/isoleucine/valine transporter permease subunit [Pirellula sp. SH-Sr6A]
MNYLIHLLIYFDIYLIVALSLNLIVGYTGMLTLAHAAFYAIGGYAYALLSINLGWGFIPAAAVGAFIAAVLSLIVSLPSWRLRGDFFVLATLAVQALVYGTLYNWTSSDAPLGSLRNLTNGPFGITGIPRPSLLGWQISNQISYGIFATMVAGFVALIVWRLTASPWGRLLKAVRDDELAAQGLGKNTRLVKLQVVAIASGLVAIAGALYAGHVRYLDPSSASLDESILMLSMVIVGGLGNFRGPFVGAALLILLPEALRFIALPDAIAANMRLLIYGVLLVVMMQFRPQGIAGDYRME